MDALEVETRIAAAAPALQALRQVAREDAGTLAAPAAEQGMFTRRLPMGLAAMQRAVAARGTGARGAAITRADGVTRPQAPTRRGRDAVWRVGQFTVARPCDRTAGEAGRFPRDAPVHRPERCDASVRHEGMPVCAGAHPVQASAAGFAPRVDRAGAARVRRAVAPEAPMDDERF